MGYDRYSVEDRTARAFSSGYATKSVDEIFKQNRVAQIHADMDPRNVSKREACDSPQHPNTVPIQLYLDVTGSMGKVPHYMIKDGLPTLIGKLIQDGVPDVTLLMGAIGDHECDKAPLQVGQFESGDKALDMWLERIWLEGMGGGNAGESYLLAWYFAAHHVHTDAFSKRGEKGFLFTVGDEPFLNSIPLSALKTIMGENAIVQADADGVISAKTLYSEAQKQNCIFHIHVKHDHRQDGPASCWSDLLGQNLLVTSNYSEIPNIISRTVLSHLLSIKDPTSIKDPASDKLPPDTKPTTML